MKKNVSPKSIANLKIPKKGDPSRNPNGRPKKAFCIPDILRKLSAERSKWQNPDEYKTRIEKMCDKALDQAESGDKDARNWVSDRMEGKAIDRILTQETKDELIIE